MHHINDIIAPGLTPHYAALAREGGPWLIVSGFARQDRYKPRAPPPLINHHNECHCPLPPPLLAGWSLRTLIKTVTSFTTPGPDTAQQEWCTAMISYVSMFYLFLKGVHSSSFISLCFPMYQSQKNHETSTLHFLMFQRLNLNLIWTVFQNLIFSFLAIIAWMN